MRLIRFDVDDIMMAVGMIQIMKSYEFLFTLIFIKDLLQIIEPVTNVLQARAIGYKDALPLIRAVHTTIENMRTQENFDKYYSEATDLLQKVRSTDVTITESRPRPIRDRRPSVKLKDSVIEESLGQRSETAAALKSAYYETIDIVLTEMSNRFVTENAILAAVDTADEMDLSALQPLKELGIDLPTEVELGIAKEYIEVVRKKNEELKKTKKPGQKDIETVILSELFKVRKGMENVYNLFTIIATFPSGTAINESSFSALTRMMRPQRQSMASKRLNKFNVPGFRG